MGEYLKSLEVEVYNLAKKRDLWVYGSVPGGAGVIVELFNVFTSESLHPKALPVLALALIAWHMPFWQTEWTEAKRRTVLKRIDGDGTSVDKELKQAGRHSWVGFMQGKNY